MFGRKIHLFTIFGLKVGIDFTWFFLAILVAWSPSSAAISSPASGTS